MAGAHVYEVLRQKAPGEAHIHVGEVEAPDDDTALVLAKEHFARREVCCSIWVVPRNAVRVSTWDPKVMQAGHNKRYRRSGGIRDGANQ